MLIRGKQNYYFLIVSLNPFELFSEPFPNMDNKIYMYLSIYSTEVGFQVIPDQIIHQIERDLSKSEWTCWVKDHNLETFGKLFDVPLDAI